MNKGFTLVETIIYTGLIGILLTSFITIATLISILKTKNLIIREINQSARQVLNEIEETSSRATSVTAPEPGNSSTTLELIAGKQTIKFSINNGVVYKNAGGILYKLNNPNNYISHLVFTNLGSNTAPSIKIELDIEYMPGQSNEFYFEDSYQTAVTLKL